jgi:uncharacterized membrane protein YphA (DoxX/SURF4 family)
MSTPEPTPWSLGTKVAFRFTFVYFLLYTLYFPFAFLPFPPFLQISALYNSLWSAGVPWISSHVLHLTHDFSTDFRNTAAGSKDTTYVYVQVLCYLAIAAVATVIWSVLDGRRRDYRWLHNWFMAYIRMVLAAVMIPYGAAKLLPVQFPAPSLSKLLETYGDSSPMGLMWTFMGASATYSFFGGATEVLSGLLLVIPRLATLGALVCIGVMSNVLVLNLGYDVPVKLGSLHLILMAAFVVAPDLRRLLDFFVLNRRTEPAPVQPLFRHRLLNGIAIGLQVAFGVVLLTYNVAHNHLKVERANHARASAPLYGIWSVDQFTLDGQARPPLLTDTTRWQRLIIESPGDAAVQPMQGPVRYSFLHMDGSGRRFLLNMPDSPGWSAEFSYENPQPDLLILTGRIAGSPVTVTLHKEDESKFSLTSRGFHWIQENSANW